MPRLVVEHARFHRSITALLVRALTALFAEGDLERAEALFDEAYALAQRVGDRDVQVLALSGRGRSYIKAGQIDKGLALLDEATASAISGDLKPHSTGIVYCLTISSCRDLGDYRRAAEWTEAANQWCDRLDVTGFPGACRIHRAEVQSKVWPSGRAPTTSFAAIVPFAPGRFSTMNDCASPFSSWPAVNRAATSELDPGVEPTRIWTGLAG